MHWDAETVIALITALGVGGGFQSLVAWFKERKKVEAESERTDVDTKLAYLNNVIVRLDEEAKRALAERDRLQIELTAEQERSATLRRRVREVEDEIDEIRKSARETQLKCDELAVRVKELVGDVQDKE